MPNYENLSNELTARMVQDRQNGTYVKTGFDDCKALRRTAEDSSRFTIWRPNVGVPASFLFGGLYILHMYIPSGMNLAVKELYKMLPYAVTIIVLIISSLRNQRDKQPPESLGLPYFREDR